jgi:hypothetical protein
LTVPTALLFSECGYTGDKYGVWVGKYANAAEFRDKTAMGTTGAGTISALKLCNGARIALYDDENFRGNNKVFTEDVPCLAPHGLDDRVASMEVMPPFAYAPGRR